MIPWAPAALAGVALLVTLPAGGWPFTLAVLVWAGVTLVELTALLAAAGRRPVVPATAVGALGASVSVLVAGPASWDRLPLLMAFMLLSAFALALVTPRKRQVTITMTATVLPALVIGLGTTGVLVLRSASAGFRWTLGLLLVTVVPAVLAAATDRGAGVPMDAPVRVVSAGAIGGALLFGLSPPFTLVSAAALTAIGVGAGWATVALVGALPAAGADAGERDRNVVRALTLLSAPLIAAPVVAFLASATQA